MSEITSSPDVSVYGPEIVRAEEPMPRRNGLKARSGEVWMMECVRCHASVEADDSCLCVGCRGSVETVEKVEVQDAVEKRKEPEGGVREHRDASGGTQAPQASHSDCPKRGRPRKKVS